MSTAYQKQIQELGKRIKFIRTARNVTQSEVAAIAQISRTRMSQLESGTANPKFDTLCALAYALDCDLATLTSIVSPRHQSKKTHSEPTEAPAKSSPPNEPSSVIVYSVHPVPFKSKLEETELLESD